MSAARGSKLQVVDLELHRREVLLSYRRGYNRARAGHWPTHSTDSPIPPGALGEVVRLAQRLSSQVDGFLAGFDDRETEADQLAIDATRDALAAAIDALCLGALESCTPADAGRRTT